MTTAAPSTPHVAPAQVHELLGRHMLVDGYRLVLDLAKSHGPYLHDSQRGCDLLDFYASFATLPLGYNHPLLHTAEFRERVLWAAVNKPANSDVYTTFLAEFVETFARTVPEPLRRHMFFIEGGSLAVENALKTAFDWKVRKNMAKGKGEKGQQIIHFRQAFHGRSGYTMSLTNTDPKKVKWFPRFPWPRIHNPALSFPVTDEVMTRVLREEAEAVAAIRQALVDNPDDIAGLIVETIQGEGGDNHFRPEFLRQLRELADENEFLLIFDEVQTGFGTTGTWWAFEPMGVVPDVFSFGKKTQVCGICAGPRIDEVDSVFHVSSRINSTWGGNLVDMIRAQRFVEIIEEANLLDNVRRTGERLVEGFQALSDEFAGKVTNPRGRGMFAALDLPDGETRDRAIKAMGETRVLALPSGDRAIRFRPPMILTDAHVDEGLGRMREAFSQLL